MSVGWTYDDIFLKHLTGPEHPESPERLRTITAALRQAGLLARLQDISFEPARPEDVCGIHDEAYVELLRLACEHGMTFIGSSETCICPRSYEVAMAAAGAVLAACDAVMAGRVRRAFCAVRPPGHHALRDCAGGFCLLNNVAIAADHLLRRHGLRRVAIVDFDAHHGNGTQQAFEEHGGVLYISLHQHPWCGFPHTGYAGETGRGKGAGLIVNIPLPPGSDEAAYMEALEKQALGRLQQFAPEFLLLSAGFDASHLESLARMNLKPESFGKLTAILAAAADQHCRGRIVSVLEGGYHLNSLGRSAAAHVRALMDGH